MLLCRLLQNTVEYSLIFHISLDSLILDDPILERYLCLESWRSRIPF